VHTPKNQKRNCGIIIFGKKKQNAKSVCAEKSRNVRGEEKKSGPLLLARKERERGVCTTKQQATRQARERQASNHWHLGTVGSAHSERTPLTHRGERRPHLDEGKQRNWHCLPAQQTHARANSKEQAKRAQVQLVACALHLFECCATRTPHRYHTNNHSLSYNKVGHTAAAT
jgi:hypothetical protein